MIKRNFAIFGGSFDPPHLGHQEIVKRVLEFEDIDGVIVVPTYLNPFKESFHLKPELRLELLREIFKDMKEVIVEDFEIKQKKAVYTVETIKALKKRYNITSIVVGADNLKSIDKWRDFEWLNLNFSWIVATRKGQSLENLKLLRKKRVLNLNIPISSTKIRAGEGLEFIDKRILKKILQRSKD